jgi:hypothetical protein
MDADSYPEYATFPEASAAAIALSQETRKPHAIAYDAKAGTWLVFPCRADGSIPPMGWTTLTRWYVPSGTVAEPYHKS